MSFCVASGEVLGIVGESGSGKSVTLRAIPKLLHANAAVTATAPVPALITALLRYALVRPASVPMAMAPATEIFPLLVDA